MENIAYGVKLIHKDVNILPKEIPGTAA